MVVFSGNIGLKVFTVDIWKRYKFNAIKVAYAKLTRVSKSISDSIHTHRQHHIIASNSKLGPPEESLCPTEGSLI